MKRVFHWFNFVFCILLAALGVLMIVFRGKALEEPTSIFVIMGGVQITLAFVMFLIGALLPKDGRYVTGKAKIILKIILVLAALGNNSPGSLAAYDLADGRVKVQRFWEPALPLAWLFTEATFLAFFPSSGILAVAVFGSGAVLVLLFIGSLGWKILELKEKNIYRMLYVILPSLIIIGIFALIFLITFIQQWIRGPKLSEQLAETRAEIEETLDSYGEEKNADVPETYSDLDMDGVVALVRADLDKDMYYRWIIGDDNMCSMVLWSDADDEVYVYQFEEENGLYNYISSFASGSISREDVEGKEDGMIRVGSG